MVDVKHRLRREIIYGLSMAAVVLLPFPTYAGFFGPGNWAECIIDRMPGVQSDPIAYSINQACIAKYGNALTVALGSGRGFTGYDSGAECAAEKGREIRSTVGAGVLNAACHRLYDAPPVASASANTNAFVNPFK